MDGLGDARVADVMTRALITVNPETTVQQMAKMMEQGGIGAILVRDAGRTSGIVTDRDYATKVAARGLPPETPAGKIMSSPLVTVPAGATLQEAAVLMTSRRIRKLAVADGPEIVGIVTSTDLVARLAG